jgi:hypothetical protein
MVFRTVYTTRRTCCVKSAVYVVCIALLCNGSTREYTLHVAVAVCTTILRDVFSKPLYSGIVLTKKSTVKCSFPCITCTHNVKTTQHIISVRPHLHMHTTRVYVYVGCYLPLGVCKHMAFKTTWVCKYSCCYYMHPIPFLINV